MATKKPVNLCNAGYTFPKRPYPLHSPKLKSDSEILFLKVFALIFDIFIFSPKLTFAFGESTNLTFERLVRDP
jgi:hypothetical protein